MLNYIKYKNYRVKIKKMTIKQAKSENAFGLYLSDKSTIFIQKNLSVKNYLSILFHELGHFIIDKAKIKPKSEESFAILIEEFSNIFLQNPKLLNFIKQCSKKNET